MTLVVDPPVIVPPAETVHVYPVMDASVVYVLPVVPIHEVAEPVIVGTGNEFTLPTTAGTSGKVLSSNGDGTTSWDSSVAGWSSGSTGFTYWQKDPTGLIRQWGIGPSMPPNSDNICYMPYSFSNTNYTITIGNVREPGGNAVFVMVRDATKNLNYFTMTTGAGEFIGTSAPYWYAIGY